MRTQGHGGAGTRQQRAAVIAAVRSGAKLDAAASAAGVTNRTVKRWRQKLPSFDADVKRALAERNAADIGTAGDLAAAALGHGAAQQPVGWQPEAEPPDWVDEGDGADTGHSGPAPRRPAADTVPDWPDWPDWPAETAEGERSDTATQRPTADASPSVPSFGQAEQPPAPTAAQRELGGGFGKLTAAEWASGLRALGDGSGRAVLTYDMAANEAAARSLLRPETANARQRRIAAEAADVPAAPAPPYVPSDDTLMSLSEAVYEAQGTAAHGVLSAHLNKLLSDRQAADRLAAAA